jgi:hypothetical protein
MRCKIQWLFLIAITVAALLGSFSSAEAQETVVGIRAGYYTDVSDAFVGGELLTSISNHTYFNPNVEYVFTDGFTFLTFNGDFHHDFPSRSSTFYWLGAGLAALYTNPEGEGDNQTDLGVNLLGGIGFSRGSTIPYVQGKFVLSDNSEFVVGFGLRF